jgi:hypothetical protein
MLQYTPNQNYNKGKKKSQKGQNKKVHIVPIRNVRKQDNESQLIKLILI